jgi:hypothetical protein
MLALAFKAAICTPYGAYLMPLCLNAFRALNVFILGAGGHRHAECSAMAASAAACRRDMGAEPVGVTVYAHALFALCCSWPATTPSGRWLGAIRSCGLTRQKLLFWLRLAAGVFAQLTSSE